MRISKQIDKHNQFNIENLTLAKVLGIINSLEFCKNKGLLTNAQCTLLDALNAQQHKLKLG